MRIIGANLFCPYTITCKTNVVRKCNFINRQLSIYYYNSAKLANHTMALLIMMKMIFNMYDII